MAMKDFMQKMKGMVGKVTAPREKGQKAPTSTMPNGSVSGYQPRVGRTVPVQQGPATHPAASFDRMTPAGVNPGPQFMPPLAPVQPQPVPVQQAPQPYGNQATSQPIPPAGPMGTTSMPPVQQPMQPPVQPRPAWSQPNYQPPAPAPVMQTAPQQPANPESNVRYFPGTVADEAGNPYAMVMRVAQVTGIASCYALLEFMQYDEAIIVNLDQITDVLEANRCIDMLFGAAYAMHHNFERIASRSVYLIAPQRVHVLPCESMLQMSQQDADTRWPGLSRMSAPAYRQGRREDFAPGFGRQAAAPRPGQYTEYGGFGASR